MTKFQSLDSLDFEYLMIDKVSVKVFREFFTVIIKFRFSCGSTNLFNNIRLELDSTLSQSRIEF